MDITQVTHSKDNVFGRTPQVKGGSADDFARYIDTDTSDASYREVREAREADHHDDDYRKDDVDASSDTERSENNSDKDTATNESREDGAGETVVASVADILTPQTTEGTQEGTEVIAAGDTEGAVIPDGDGLPTTTASGDKGAAQQSAENAQQGKAPNPNAAVPAEAAQAAVTNGPASDVAKARMTAGQVAETTTATDTTAKQQVPLVAGNDKKAEVTVQQTSAAQQTAAVQSGKETKAQTTQAAQTDAGNVAQAKGAPTSLEQMRADEVSRMSEKEVLSQKLSELLSAARGKIVGVQGKSTTTATGNTSAATMVSGQNMMQAAVTPQVNQVTPPTATAVGTVTQNVAQAEIPIIVPTATDTAAPIPGQGQAAAATADLSQSGTLATTTGAVAGVDSTSSSSASQASLAGRATAQAGSPAEQVSTQLMNAAKDGNEKIKVQLHPAELGRVDIRLEITQDGRVMAAISADNQNSLDLLQQDSKALEQALKDAGFNTDQNSLNFSLNQGSEGFEEGPSPNGGVIAAESEEEITLETQLAALSAQNATSNGLNIRV